ncbi:hypothetical protein C8F01DRAFT_37834 [Mycena amicta]|nr:hypothetical protein C8F01DRAFT_37834 [Mycena amicta]
MDSYFLVSSCFRWGFLDLIFTVLCFGLGVGRFRFFRFFRCVVGLFSVVHFALLWMLTPMTLYIALRLIRRGSFDFCCILLWTRTRTLLRRLCFAFCLCCRGSLDFSLVLGFGLGLVDIYGLFSLSRLAFAFLSSLSGIFPFVLCFRLGLVDSDRLSHRPTVTKECITPPVHCVSTVRGVPNQFPELNCETSMVYPV